MPQDVVKLCYQAAFGAEHLLSDISAAKRYFDMEFEKTEAREGELFERVSDGVGRVDLGVWKASGMPREWLFNMFAASASVKAKDEAFLTFEKYLQSAEAVFEGNARFGTDDWHAFIKEYRALGVRAVHHSERYRENERPAYRIVDCRFIPIFSILEKLACLPETQGAKVIAIDGRAASGKTTLAELLRLAMDAPVVRMDDFFLPPVLRTSQRLSETGGNIHYERFAEEILPFVKGQEAFSYGVFDCGSMTVRGKQAVRPHSWKIVEGSYSHHPIFGEYADYSIFCSVSPDEQIKRIIARNGEKMAERFKNEWIPMEEKYFEAFDICEKADVVIKT